MNILTIYRAAAVIAVVDIDEKTVFKRKLMGEHRITTVFVWPRPLPVAIGDYVTHDAENYYINRIPGINKINNTAYEYTIDFESVGYDLSKKLFISIDGLSEFGQAGTATDFVTRVVANMNTIGSGWTVGTVDTTVIRTIVFSNQHCDAVLMKVAEEFRLEFRISGKAITMVKAIGFNTAYSFTYGRGLGLYSLTRQQIGDMNIVTKVFGFGSMQNIPYTYRNRAKRLVFSTDRPYTSPPVGYGGGDRYLTKNTELYGVIEGQYTNNDIFPNWPGIVTNVHMEIVGGVYNPSLSWIEDFNITFDLNAYRVQGADWMVVFKTGWLAGKEYVITRYDHSLKRIYLNPYSEEDGYTTPNAGITGQPYQNDLYTLVNIYLPQEYIDAAEESLLTATKAWLDENSIPQVVYSIEIDPKYAKSQAIHLQAGDRVTIVDTALGINTMIRVSAIEYPLSDLYSIRAIIADRVPYTLTERVVHGTIGNQEETRIVDRSADELTRRWAMRQNQLLDLIFDSDGYFDGTHIRPLTVETMYLTVGAKSQNFHLNGVRIKPNWNESQGHADANSLWVSGGQLVHHMIEIVGLGYTWVIQNAVQFETLAPATAYYLYCRCSKAALEGNWVLSSTQITVESEAGYYHFLCGILYAVLTDDLGSWRDFDFTYGMTYINGRTITTGRIQSLNRLNFFDLDTNQFRIGDSNTSLEWNKDQDGALRLIGILIQRNPSGDAYPIMLYRGGWINTTTYYRGDQVTYQNQTWVYKNVTPSSGNIPEAGSFWELLSSIGTEGAPGASPVSMFRGEYGDGIQYYGNSVRVDIVYWPQTQLYYIAKANAPVSPFTGMKPNNTAFWSNFGANFENIATSFIFAENALLQNVRVQFFEGIPAGSGDLCQAATVTHTQANITGTQRVDEATITGDSGSVEITCDGITKTFIYQYNWEASCQIFIQQYGSDWYAAGVLVSYRYNSGTGRSDVLVFTERNGQDFTGATSLQHIPGETMYGTVANITAHSASQARIDTIKITGTGGMANVHCDGKYAWLYFEDTLTQTAQNFVDNNAAQWLLTNVLVTVDTTTVPGEVHIVMTARYPGEDFVDETECYNLPSDYNGAISIASNQIWDDQTNGRASMLINMKGYKGAFSFGREVIIGNGMNQRVMTIGRQSSGKDVVEFEVDQLHADLSRLPRSTSGLVTGDIYIDANGFMKMKTV